MECPYIPVTPYGDFSQRVHDKVNGQRIPISGSIELTTRCNLHCVHCYINTPAADPDALARELDTKTLCTVLDQLADEGCLWLLLTGGEPLLRPDFLEIYTYAKRKGFLITIFTNGTALTPRVADHLAEWPPFCVEITIYGRTEATYERVTGVRDSHRQCIDGINELIKRQIPLKLKTMVLTVNKDELWDMKHYAEKLGVEFRFDPVLNVRLDGDRAPAAFRIPPQEVVKFDLADEQRLKGWREFCERFWGPPHAPEYLYQCGAGLTTFHIDPYGFLSACMMARLPRYDLRRGSFHEGWHDFLQEVRTQPGSRQTKCKTCDLISLCGQCPGWAQIEHGDQEAPVEYLCEIAHARAAAFGLKVRKRQNANDNIREKPSTSSTI